MLSHCVQAISFGWLFEGRTRAKLSICFGTVMLVVFVPGLYHAATGYDIPPPNAAFCGMAGVFVAIILSGYLHLGAEERTKSE